MAEPPALPGLEELVDTMPCGLLVTAADGTILRVNRTFCAWVGAQAAELVGQRRLQDLFTTGARIFHHTHWLPMLQMQGSISEVKLDVKGVGGRTLPMLLNVLRRVTEEGTYDQVCAVIAEDRNKYERELLAARKRADELVRLEQDRALFAEQMIGIVSHDLRNPLGVVAMAAHLLAGDSDRLGPQKRRSILDNITRATERARRLIDDLLDFTVARVGRGVAITRGVVDLPALVARSVEELQLAYPNRTLVHLHLGDQHAVMADADRIAQLLGNLVSNALRHGAADGPVTATTCVTGDKATVAVHNLGPTIATSVLAVMFEPMVRGTSDGSNERSVGLGLFIVQAIAKAHGGEVAVQSGDGAGTTFTLTFPRGVPPDLAS